MVHLPFKDEPYKGDCLVGTNTGIYRGTQAGPIQTFKGIRYALPPAGDLRFCPPVPVSRSDNLIDARSFSPVSFQPGNLAHLSGADSLSLNIWRNAEAGNDAPVLFFVHGGSFYQGSGREPLYDGTVLAKEWNMVVVTINYRLGAFGFLDFSGLDRTYIANPALHDIVQALKWTHENIEAFGGDPDNITVAGSSAGGSLVSALPVLDDTAPLLNRLILFSGIPTAFLPVEAEAELVKCFMDYFHIADARGLRRLSDKEIMYKTPDFMKKSGLGLGTFQPVMDGRYLKAYPINILSSGNYQPLPMLIGNTGDELSVMKYFFGRRYWDLRKIISDGLSNEEEPIKKQISLLYTKKYGRRKAQVQLISDMIFRTASLFYAEAASPKCPVWLYRFDLCPVAMRLSGLGAVHCSDLPLFFGNFRKGIGKLMFSLSTDLTAAGKLACEMQSDFTGFMKNGHLPWARAFIDGYLAKCYNVPPGFDEPIPRDIYNAYRQTHYYALNRRKVSKFN